MKVLLLGEFSGVHNNLKKGLEQQGCRVTLANNGDYYKKLQQDIKISPFKGKYFGKLLNIIYFLFNIRKFIGYDVVQFISPFVLPYYFSYFGIPFLLFKFNSKIVYYACGTDPIYLASKNRFKYFPFDDKNDEKYPRYDVRGKLNNFNAFLNHVDLIIPSSYDYLIGYSSNPKTSKPILLPCSGCYNEVIDLPTTNTNILFGITRRGIKGADYILNALEKIKQNYSKTATLAIVERVPFDEYIDYLKQCDVLVDQCKSYGYGMNAIFALEQGKIVLSGAEKEALDCAGVQNCPVINITPNVDQIYQELEKVLLFPREGIMALKKRGVDYAKEYHDPIKIGAQFFQAYTLIRKNGKPDTKT